MEEPGSARARGSAPVALRILLALGFVVAAGATVLAVLSSDARLLRLAVVLALWAALIAAFAVTRSRRDAKSAALRESEAQLAYQLELQREVSARHEYEADLAVRMASAQSEQIADLREQLDRLTEVLSSLADGELLVSRLTLSAESARFRAGQSVIAGSAAAQWSEAARELSRGAHEAAALVDVPDLHAQRLASADLGRPSVLPGGDDGVLGPGPVSAPVAAATGGTAVAAPASDAVVPVTVLPELAAPEKEAPEEAPEEELPETEAPETELPGTELPETELPETVAPAAAEPEARPSRHAAPDSAGVATLGPPPATPLPWAVAASAPPSVTPAPGAPSPSMPAFVTPRPSVPDDVSATVSVPSQSAASGSAGGLAEPSTNPDAVSVDELLAAYGLTGSPRRRRRE